MAATVHPKDSVTFENDRTRAFKLVFPSPAFFGDIEDAPIVILQYNGGSDATSTPDEFPDADRHAANRDRLSRSAPVNAAGPTVPDYDRYRDYFDWLVRMIREWRT